MIPRVPRTSGRGSGGGSSHREQTAMATPRPTSSSNGLLSAVWKLVRLRLRLSLNGFKHAKRVKKFFIILGYVGLLALAVGLCVGSWLLLKFLRSPELGQYVGLDVTGFLGAVPVLIFTALFLGILMTSFGVLLQALYLSGDMDFLLASPVPIRAVFAAKLLQAVLPNFGLIALFGLPVLFGLGFSEGYTFLYYPLVVLVMIALALAAAGLSALLVMLVVKILPPRRAAEILGFLGATLGLLCGQLGNLFKFYGNDAEISGSQANSLFTLITQVNTPWMPLNWAGQGLVALGQGHWATGLLLVALTLGLCAGAFLFALATAERWYYTGWAGMQVVTRKKKPLRAARPAAARMASASPISRLLPSPIWAILWKDFLVYRRDLRQMSQLISPLILGVIYTLMILRTGGQMPVGKGEAPAWFMDSMNYVLAYSSVGMSLFVGWVSLSRLAGMSFASEGKNYWILKSSPLRTVHLLVAKFLVAYLPAFVLGLFFLVAIAFAQKMAIGSVLYSILAMSFCLAGMNGILLGFGVAGAKLDWDDPRKMNAGNMGCLGQIIAAAFLPLTFGLFIGPLFLVSVLNWPVMYGYLLGGIVGIAVNLAAAILPPALARKKVASLGES
jgi:ABC-2 type transport system permease protein